jgi:3-oxoacyl-[acyl-carrier-protein] synthase-3
VNFTREVCYVKNENGQLTGFSDFTPIETVEKSIFSIKQDVKLLGDNIVKLGLKNLEIIFAKKGINVSQVDHFVPHLSSYFFEDKIYDELKSIGMEIPKDKWFTNLESCGNVGAASVYMMIDDLWKSNKLKIGETILIAVPESARFTYVFAMFTVC